MNNYVEAINSCESRIKDKLDILKRYGIDTGLYDGELTTIINDMSNGIQPYKENVSSVAVKFINEAGYAKSLERLQSLETKLDNRQSYLKIHFKINSIIKEVTKTRDFSENRMKLYVKECINVLKDAKDIKSDSLEESKRVTMDIYETIYEVIKLELVANGKSSLLDYMLKNKIGLEYINDLVRDDIEYLEERDLYTEDVDKHITRVSKEGINYTYADEDLILSIALLTDDRIIDRLKSKKEELDEDITEVKERKEKNKEAYDDTLYQIGRHTKAVKRSRRFAGIGSVLMALNIFGYLHAPSMLQKKYSDVTYQTTREVYDTVSDETRSEEVYGKKKAKEFTELKVYGPVKENGKRKVTTYELSEMNLDDISEYTTAIDEDTRCSSEQTIDYRFGEQLSREEYSTVEKMTYGEEKVDFDQQQYDEALVRVYIAYQLLVGTISSFILASFYTSFYNNRKRKQLEEANESRKSLAEAYDKQIERCWDQMKELDQTTDSELSSEEYKKLILK